MDEKKTKKKLCILVWCYKTILRPTLNTTRNSNLKYKLYSKSLYEGEREKTIEK